MHVRDQAGSLSFPNGSGPIREMISMPDGLWIFKRDGAYKTTLPDLVDPGRTNPSLPVQKHWYPELGTSDPIVARLFIQPMKMLHELDPRDKDEPPGFKTKLLESCRTMQVVARRLEAFSAMMAKQTVAEDPRGRSSFPAVEIPGDAQVNAVVDEVLGNLKRVSQAALNIPHHLLGISHVGNPNFDKVQRELSEKYGEEDNIARIIGIHRDALVEMVEMRNAIEHPKDGQRLTVTEMRLGASGVPEDPKLIFDHKGTTKEFPMLDYLQEVAARVFNLSEEIFICCIEKRDMLEWCPYIVCEIEANQIDVDCPMKYVGMYQLRKPAQGEASS